MTALLEEITRKEEYNPIGKEQEYLNSLKSCWKLDLDADQKPYDFFQRKNKLAYMQQNEADSYALFNETKKDRWRNNTRITTQRDKVDAIISAVADLNLQEEIHSFNAHGERARSIETPLEHLIEFANVLDEYERKQKMAVFYLLTHGSLSEEVCWLETNKKGKVLKSVDYESGTFKADKGTELKNNGKIWTRIQPLNRLILGDITQPFINLQPRIWKEFVFDYNLANQYFGKWKNFKKYVKPVAQVSREWTSLESESQAEDMTSANKVHCLVYENIWQDEYAVICNGVLVTPVGYPMPSKFLDKKYSCTLTQLYDFSPNFAYGYSFVQRLHNDAGLKDFFYNALVDRVRQELEPPLVTSYRSIVNRHMFKPGSVTPVGGEFKVEQIIKDQGGINHAQAMVEFIDNNLDKVVPPIFGGGSPQGATTAYEIREQMKNALRTMYNIFSSVAYARKQRAELVLRLILEKYPEMGIGTVDDKVSKAVGGVKHIFTTKGRASDLGGDGVAQVAFAKIPSGADRLGVFEEMAQSEATGKTKGEIKKWHILDSKAVFEMEHSVFVAVNPSQRKSKLADSYEAREDYVEFMNNPLLDKKVVTREYLVEKGKDPEKYIIKQQPAVPGQEQMKQSGQEQMMPPMKPMKSPAQATEQKMNNLEKAAI